MGVQLAAATRWRAASCQTVLASPSVKGTPRDASKLGFNPVGSLRSVEQAVISASVMIVAEVRESARRRWGGGPWTRMVSPFGVWGAVATYWWSRLIQTSDLAQTWIRSGSSGFGVNRP